jgi:hypothetical protein
VRRQSAAATALWILLFGATRDDPKRRRRCALPPHSKLRPKSLLQFIESFDDVFLKYVLSFGHNWFAANHHFAYRRARRRKHDCSQQIITRSAGNRSVIEIDREEVGRLPWGQSPARRANTARSVNGRAIE